GVVVRSGAAAAHAARVVLAVLRALVPVARRACRHAIAVLAMLGVLVLLDVGLALVWKEPVTAFLASRAQDDLRSQLAALDREPAMITPAQARQLAAIRDPGKRAAARIAFLAQRLDATTRPGRALGTLQIKRIGIDFVLVQGTGAPALRKGPGHYQVAGLGLPGEGRAVGIAGHRTTYEAPFRSIDALRPGDQIV